MKEKRPKYSVFDKNDLDQLKDVVFRAQPIRYTVGDKGIILGILGNNVRTVVYSGVGHTSIPGATTQLYRQALAAMEFISNAIGDELEYVFVSSNEKMKKWALDPKKGAELFNWDKITYDRTCLHAYKIIKPLPTRPDVGHCVI